MAKIDIYWHKYRRHQIRPELRGNLILVFEIPLRPGVPVVRHIFDVVGTHFPEASRAANVLADMTRHGIVFEGINKAAAFELLLTDPPLSMKDPDFAFYNREIVRNAQQFFLTNPNRQWRGTPAPTARLLRGLAPVPDRKKATKNAAAQPN